MINLSIFLFLKIPFDIEITLFYSPLQCGFWFNSLYLKASCWIQCDQKKVGKMRHKMPQLLNKKIFFKVTLAFLIPNNFAQMRRIHAMCDILDTLLEFSVYKKPLSEWLPQSTVAWSLHLMNYLDKILSKLALVFSVVWYTGHTNERTNTRKKVPSKDPSCYSLGI